MASPSHSILSRIGKTLADRSELVIETSGTKTVVPPVCPGTLVSPRSEPDILPAIYIRNARPNRLFRARL